MSREARLRETSSDSFEQALLDSASLDRHPKDGAERALAALALLGGPTATPAAGAGASASPAAVAPKVMVAAKLLGVVLVSAVAAGGAALALRTDPAPTQSFEVPSTVVEQPRPPNSAQVAPEPASLSIDDSARVEQRTGGVSASPPSARGKPTGGNANVPAPSASVSGVTSLGPELSLVDDARAALGRGDLVGATRALDAYDKAFPTGTLAAEAKVTRIELCLAEGQSARAVSLGESFLASHPSAAYERRVTRLVERARRRAP